MWKKKCRAVISACVRLTFFSTPFLYQSKVISLKLKAELSYWYSVPRLCLITAVPIHCVPVGFDRLGDGILSSHDRFTDSILIELAELCYSPLTSDQSVPSLQFCQSNKKIKKFKMFIKKYRCNKNIYHDKKKIVKKKKRCNEII